MSNETMTPAQAVRLEALCAEAGETFESALSKDQAARRIERLERKLGRNQPPLDGGDGGTSIRANEAPSDEHPPLD